MFSDQLVEALKRLDIHSTASVKEFKRAIRASFERFLRFTHRYWFHEISEQAQVRALSHLGTTHLGLDPLYAEVKERSADMNSYLDTDSLRRQASTVVRLTVVTLFGLIGTVTTGFLGMNLLAEADAPLWRKAVWFGVVFVATSWLRRRGCGGRDRIEGVSRLQRLVFRPAEHGLSHPTRASPLQRGIAFGETGSGIAGCGCP